LVHPWYSRISDLKTVYYGYKCLDDLNVAYYFVFVQMGLTAKEKHHYFKLSFPAPKHLKRNREVVKFSAGSTTLAPVSKSFCQK